MRAASSAVVDPAIIARQPQQVRPEVEPTAIEWVLMCAANCPDFYAEIAQQLKPFYFQPHEAPLQLAWIVIAEAYTRYGRPTFESVCYLAEQQLRTPLWAALQEQCDPEWLFRNDGSGFFYGLTHPESDAVFSTTNLALAREILQQFMLDRQVLHPLRRMLNTATHGGVPVSINAFLQDVSQRAAQIQTTGRLPLVDMAPEIGTEIRQASVFRPIGLDYMDRSLLGQRVGDAIGLLGPTGGGKTTLAIHAAVRMVEQCWAQWQATGAHGPPPYVVFATYEEEGLKLRPRVQSAMMKIPQEKLAHDFSWDMLTTADTLEDYERRMQHGASEMLSETDRYRLYAPLIRNCFAVLDMSGQDEANPQAGRGGVPELAGCLARLQETRPGEMYAVVIDYAGLVCINDATAPGDGSDNAVYRSRLKTFGDAVRRQIAARFKTTAWILHQLRGEAGNFAPTRLPKHTDAGESKDFADNLAVCVCLGTQHQSTGCCFLNFSKVRYRSKVNIPPVILRMDDQFATIDDVSSRYTLSEEGGGFMLRSEAGQIGGVAGLSRRNGG